MNFTNPLVKRAYWVLPCFTPFLGLLLGIWQINTAVVILFLPRIVDAGQEVGLIMESLMAAIAHKQRLRDFLEGRAKKVGE